MKTETEKWEELAEESRIDCIEWKAEALRLRAALNETLARCRCALMNGGNVYLQMNLIQSEARAALKAEDTP